MDKALQLGESVKKKRTGLGWSQETLAYKSGVSSSVINKIEKGMNVKNENLGKVLLTLGMKETLFTFREDDKITGYKALSLEELRTCIAACKDFMRDGSDEVKRETMSYRKSAELELLSRLRDLFRGELPPGY